MEIMLDDLRGPEIAGLLQEHLDSLKDTSPPESRHALDLEGLRQPGITFWSAWDQQQLAGCGALKSLQGAHAEIKSMRTASSHLRKGVASLVLGHLIAVARERGLARLSLETGSMDYFIPARALYSKFGFVSCEPFASYVEDPNSVFMKLDF
ncbi:MAG: GNAT family N-acetyltransferase [Pseudomonadota bacterium]